MSMHYEICETRAALVMPHICVPVLPRVYPGIIDDELRPWHCYVVDAGHSVIALLAEDVEVAFAGKPSQYLIPIPVKSVMREYAVRDGYIVAKSPLLGYEPQLGLLSPPEDDEY